MKKQHQIVEHLSVATWGDVKDKKIAFFAKDKDDFEVLGEAVTAPFKPLLDSWLRPLAELVAWAHTKANERAPRRLRSGKRAPSVDLETLGGNMTYKVFLETFFLSLYFSLITACRMPRLGTCNVYANECSVSWTALCSAMAWRR